MPIVHKTKSDYAGFLNGYIAGNLSANSQELHFHSDKIISFLKELKIEIDKWNLSEVKKASLEQLLSNLTVLPTSENTIESYIKLGSGIHEIISLIKGDHSQETPSTIDFILKKIIFHFLNIAKTSKNRSVIRQGTLIAQKFDDR